jgi:hypothetical protein
VPKISYWVPDFRCIRARLIIFARRVTAPAKQVFVRTQENDIPTAERLPTDRQVSHCELTESICLFCHGDFYVRLYE